VMGLACAALVRVSEVSDEASGESEGGGAGDLG
jgi:hypothetical protein